MMSATTRALVPPLDGGVVNPVHVALDHLTSISIHVQQMRRRVQQQAVVDPSEVDRALRPVEAGLRELSEILLELRDRREPA